ncbi:hypothetical protein OTU49_015425, partial [Cherax quadricarinatus]
WRLKLAAPVVGGNRERKLWLQLTAAIRVGGVVMSFTATLTWSHDYTTTSGVTTQDGRHSQIRRTPPSLPHTASSSHVIFGNYATGVLLVLTLFFSVRSPSSEE